MAGHRTGEYKKCGNPECGNMVYVRKWEILSYPDKVHTCCKDCAENPLVLKIKKENFIKKHGYEYPSQNPVTKLKIKEKNAKKFRGEDRKCANPDCNNIVHIKPCDLKNHPDRIYACSYECRKHPELVKRQKEKLLEKYGYVNPAQQEYVKEKIKKKFIEKYGFENVFQNEDIKKKSRATLKEKYGHEHIMQCPEFLEKACKTRIEKYGIENLTGVCPTEKTKETNNKKYGNSWFFGSAYGKMNLDYFINKYGETDGKLLYEEMKRNQTRNSRSFGKNVSKISTDFFEKLITNSGIDAEKCKYGENEIDLIQKNTTSRDITLSYDFNFEDKLIEFNGDYWHANPKKYKPDSIIRMRYNNVRAEDIWKKDHLKYLLAIKSGYEIITIWESDFIKYPSLTLFNAIKFIKGDNKNEE
jgi:hypothetical protein